MTPAEQYRADAAWLRESAANIRNKSMDDRAAMLVFDARARHRPSTGDAMTTVIATEWTEANPRPLCSFLLEGPTRCPHTATERVRVEGDDHDVCVEHARQIRTGEFA